MGVRIEHEFLEPDYQSGKAKPPKRFTIRAFEGKLVVGTVMFWLEGRNWLFPERVDVLTEFRRQGIATAMYQRAEQVTGRKIRRSRDQSDYGRQLWKKSREQRGFGYMRVPGQRAGNFAGASSSLRCRRCKSAKPTYSKVHFVEHKAGCRTAMLEAGERCPECGTEDPTMLTSGGPGDYACRACGAQWEPGDLESIYGRPGER